MSDDLLPPPAPPAPPVSTAPTPGGFAPPTAPDQGAAAVAGQAAQRPSLITVEPNPSCRRGPSRSRRRRRAGAMNVIAIAVVGVLLLGAAAVFVFGGGDGDDGSGSSGPADTTLEFEELWSAELDLGADARADDANVNVVWADDEVVLAAVLGSLDRDGQVFAIDSATGEVMWDRTMRNRVGRPESVYVAGDVTLVTETIEDDSQRRREYGVLRSADRARHSDG